MPGLGLPPGLKGRITRKKIKTGYGATPKTSLGAGAPSAFGKRSGEAIPGVGELPKAGAAARAAVPKPVSSPIPIPVARLGVPSIFLIEGKRATALEWRVWTQLLKLGWPESEIEFQVDVLGGHLPGTIILDFVIWGHGAPIIIEPSGDYWHVHTPQQIERDRTRVERLQKIWNKPFQYYSLASGDLLTDEEAYHRLLLMVGRY